MLVVVVVALAFLGTRLTKPGAPGSQSPAATTPAATEDSRAMPLDTVSPPSPVASLACDPAEQLFATMFAGLTEAALANAGIDRQAFLDALAGDRETLKRYLDALGIPADDAQLDALMAMGLPGASSLPGLPFGTAGTC